VTPFDFSKSIMITKEYLLDEQYKEKEYVPYIVNQALSYFPDTILYSNQMNINNHIDNKLQYDYLYSSITKRNRYSKWLKKHSSEDVEYVMRFYKYSRHKAEEALKCLSKEQLDIIKIKINEGGVK
jgi:hypothetical protein